MRYITRAWALLLLLSVFNAAPVQAGTWGDDTLGTDTLRTDKMFDSVSIYEGQGVNHNLKELPGKIITGHLQWDKSYFTALGFNKVRGTLGQSFAYLQNTPFASYQHGYEMVLLQHHGLQNNGEIGASCTLRTPDLQIGNLGINFMAGGGLSYALGTPSYEDGSRLDPGRRYRLQFLGLFELEWHLRKFANLSLITRVHHRSGVYGLIAPQHVGSNFLALGIRYQF